MPTAVLLNQKDSFKALLKAVEGQDLGKVREKVGSDRLDRVVTGTKKVVWSGEIISPDRVECQIVLTMPAASTAEAVAAINDGKAGLDPARVTDISVTPNGETVTVKFAVLGVKQMILDYLTKS